MPWGKHIIVVFNNKYSLKPKAQVGDNRYCESIIYIAIEIRKGLAGFSAELYNCPGKAAGDKPFV